jgi:hypothetical protein
MLVILIVDMKSRRTLRRLRDYSPRGRNDIPACRPCGCGQRRCGTEHAPRRPRVPVGLHSVPNRVGRGGLRLLLEAASQAGLRKRRPIRDVAGVLTLVPRATPRLPLATTRRPGRRLARDRGPDRVSDADREPLIRTGVAGVLT